MPGYCTLPRPRDWPCDFDGGVDMPKVTVIATWCICGKPSDESGVCPECRKKDTFDADAHRRFMRGL